MIKYTVGLGWHPSVLHSTENEVDKSDVFLEVIWGSHGGEDVGHLAVKLCGIVGWYSYQRFSSEDGGGIFLRSVGVYYLQVHTALQHRRPTSIFIEDIPPRKILKPHTKVRYIAATAEVRTAAMLLEVEN
jgi:hypothetical protein